MPQIVERRELSARLRSALRRSPGVALVAPCQVGKTTLARQVVSLESPTYFDLEDPMALERLAEPSRHESGAST